MIRIGIISGQEQDRETIIAPLYSQKDFYIASTGSSGYDALRSAADLRPDIIVMDLWMADINGTELAPMIKRQSPRTELIAIGAPGEFGWINQALWAGISGFLLKADIDNLAAAIRTVFYGGFYFSAPVRNEVFTGSSGFTSKIFLYPQARSALSHTSPIERKIINYLALGYSDKEIAEGLNIATGTVRNSIVALKRRAGLKNRIHIVTYAHLCGLINGPL